MLPKKGSRSVVTKWIATQRCEAAGRCERTLIKQSNECFINYDDLLIKNYINNGELKVFLWPWRKLHNKDYIKALCKEQNQASNIIKRRVIGALVNFGLCSTPKSLWLFQQHNRDKSYSTTMRAPNTDRPAPYPPFRVGA